MTERVFTVLCDKWGCLWQGSSYDYDRACEWAQEHNAIGDGHAAWMLDEPNE